MHGSAVVRHDRMPAGSQGDHKGSYSTSVNRLTTSETTREAKLDEFDLDTETGFLFSILQKHGFQKRSNSGANVRRENYGCYLNSYARC
jgi:hypothetical protein